MRKVVLRGGPLDGHIREVEDGARTAYFPHTNADRGELERLAVGAAAKGFVVVLVYKETSPGMPVWKYIGVNHAPVMEGET